MSVARNMLQAAAGASTGTEGAWDLSYAYYDPPAGAAWDISSAHYFQNFSISAQETNPRAVFFKPDGTKMYVAGVVSDNVNEYSLSTAWDVSTASYVQNFSVATEDTAPMGVFFKPDGTKMYVLGSTGDDVNEYSLSTAWDVSTASYVQNFSVSAQETNPFGMFFKPDGTKMYVAGSAGGDVNEYSLSTAWDVSTASYVQNFSVAVQDSTPTDVFFKPDGTKMYVVGYNGARVIEYSLSTAWDISSASYVQIFSVGAQETAPMGVFFKPDGTKMYIIGFSGDDVNEYTLGKFNVLTQDTSPVDVFFKPDGTKMYVLGDAGNDVNEYSLSSAWDTSSASYVQNFSVSGQETAPSGVFFKPDGTKMYIVGGAGDDVNEYSLSSAWDISSASYVQIFSVGAQETAPESIFFKDDGTKMYVVGSAGDDVNEYSLSSAWDISTASYVQNFSVATQETFPTGVFFKDDGTKMYIVGLTGDDVNEYSLSTAWDVSTASYVQNFSLLGMGTPEGIFFKPDGTQMFVVGSTTDAVFTYSLGVQP